MKVYEADKVVVREEKIELTSINQVLIKSYVLLSLTIFCSAITAFLTMRGWLPFVAGGVLGFIFMFGSLLLAQVYSHSRAGLIWTFVFTGLMGNSLAPILIYYLSRFTNGFGLIMASLLGTAGIFSTLSVYVWVTKKNFDFLYSTLLVALLSVLVVSVLSLFFNLTFLDGVMAAVMVIITSGLILFHTSSAIRHGVRDYVLLTISLYVNILNLFVSLLRLLAIFAGREK